MFEHSKWFKPYAAGFYAFKAGLPMHGDKIWVLGHLEMLLSYWQTYGQAENFGKAIT